MDGASRQKMTVLITGATGFLGPHLMAAFRKSYGEVLGVSRTAVHEHLQINLTDPLGVSDLIADVKPSIIVHAAALTDVTKCEQNPDLAVRNNAEATANLVEYMPPDCRFINISTDMVYSGIGTHREHSKSENPINMYGMSKFMGEFEAARAKNYLNVRTNMVGFSLGAKKPSSLVDFLVDRLNSGEPFQTFTDAMFSPLSVQTLSSLLVLMSQRPTVGTFNLGSVDGMSKSKFAMLLADQLKLSPKGMRPVESASIVGRTPRPLDTRMDVTKVETIFGFVLPSLEKEIATLCEARQWIN